MCRAGGRRCPNASGRSTQNTRQAVSRARRALRQAKETGDPAEITAARERLDTARTAHRQAKDDAVNQRHPKGQDPAADHDTTAGHDRDVTPPTTTDDTTTGASTRDESTYRYGGFTLHNTNIAHSGAHVGSQHDVTHGSTSFRYTAGDDGDVTNHINEALRRAEEAVHHATHHDRDDHDTPNGHHGHSTRNVASGNDHVAQQVGFTLADLNRLRRR
ncbi:hypothetical protein JOF41_006460 [Saccharothrix coeruleofusca]|uniref:hypothetical protein n=1 Tax=Saccharothrix coeruleofusca TaxID=33919 RepID=UPI001AEA1244|nr:hypothetical protein [Saccharothrix coeruleofusca]MBP2340282.1 hypothetical protein [Saccharothrix coeruleofusca]